jgi:hypothetical protein
MFLLPSILTRQFVIFALAKALAVGHAGARKHVGFCAGDRILRHADDGCALADLSMERCFVEQISKAERSAHLHGNTPT